VNGAILLRLTDESGITVDSVEPTVSVVSGGGEVLAVRSRGGQAPGAFSVSVRLGDAPGANVFRIEAGEVAREVTLTGN
jgi:hypothetical protein